MNYLILLIPSICVVFVMKYMFHNKISTKELFIHIGMCIIGAGIVLGISYAINYSGLHDVEILNGQVQSKSRHVETCTQYSSCEHYTLHERCHYYTDSKGKRQKSCETYKVFDYPYEVDWYIQSTVGDFKIRRVNNQGTIVPHRWNIAQIGDYAARTHSYNNYLFADEHSLFSTEELNKQYDQKYLDRLPKYPGINDYYKTYHVINYTNVNVSGFNEYINEYLKTAGKEKQVNIQVLIHNYKDIDFVDATLLSWRGGKKNDVIMFFGVDENGVVKAFTSTSFAKGMKNEELHSRLRMDALNEKLNLDLIQTQVNNIQTKFSRLSNKEFEYLSLKMEPRKDVMIVASIVLMILSIFIGLYMRDNEL